MISTPKTGEIYKHFKGNMYRIVAVATHTETYETLVVYQSLEDETKIFARPLPMFMSPVDAEKYPEVTQKDRFELVKGEECLKKQRNDNVTEGDDAVEGKSTVDGNSVVDGNNATVADTAKNAAVESSLEKQVVCKEDAACSENAEELSLDPLVLKFLDADTYEERLNILAGLHHRITDEMITTMAIACDVEVAEGNLEERYASLENCLITLEKYECNRLR